MRKILFILCILMVLGCEKDEQPIPDKNGSEQENPDQPDGSGEEQPETFNLTVENADVTTLEIVTISSSDMSFSEDSYTGTLGETAVDLVNNGDNTLSLLIPSSLTGEHDLKLEIDEKLGVVAFKIQEQVTEDATEVIYEAVEKPIGQLSNILEQINDTDNLDDGVFNQLESAKQMLAYYENAMTNLTAEEKLEMALFYEANPQFSLNFLLELTRALDGNTDYDCFDKNAERIVIITAAVLIASVEGIPLLVAKLSTIIPGGIIATVVGYAAGIYAAVSIISYSREKLLKDCFLPFEQELKAFDKSYEENETFEFYNREPKEFSILTSERHIVSSDANANSDYLSNVASKMNELSSKWSSVKDTLNQILSDTANWFTSWFSSSSQKLELITYDFGAIPSSSEERQRAGKSEFISMQGFPSDINVKVTKNSSSSIEIEFNADDSSLPRSFSGKIRYDDGNFITEDDVRVKLDKIIDSTSIYEEAVLGEWSVLTLSSPSEPRKLMLYEDGYGRYVGDGPNGANKDGIDDDGNAYWEVSWRIYKSEGRYFLRESGFYHSGFESYRTFDLSLEKVHLTYPVTTFLTYTDFGSGPGEADRRYTKI